MPYPNQPLAFLLGTTCLYWMTLFAPPLPELVSEVLLPLRQRQKSTIKPQRRSPTYAAYPVGRRPQRAPRAR